MSGFERVAMLMSLMRELGELMRAETGLVRSMQLDRLSALQDEKATLAESYERAVRQIRSDPALVGALDPAGRRELETAMRGFQEIARDNGHRLRAAREIVEGVMQCLGRSLSVPVSGYGRPGGRPGTIVPLSVDRRA